MFSHRYCSIRILKRCWSFIHLACSIFCVDLGITEKYPSSLLHRLESLSNLLSSSQEAYGAPDDAKYMIIMLARLKTVVAVGNICKSQLKIGFPLHRGMCFNALRLW
ncbi:uncharacterized protein LOC132630909 [Lycium barbarum]|uniref:uncharacterized protein LOC132630909 n=1 Tax=Lycium barbarum TaxID=112863 RepID=UPI00293E5525|nr:uncharacterized protein LOC132630909 [Lycium barbarum]